VSLPECLHKLASYLVTYTPATIGDSSMATVLLSWELGGGLGHLVRLWPIAKGILNRGHRVVAVVQDVVQARRVFLDQRVAVLPAPTTNVPAFEQIKLPRSFAHVLHNTGFGNRDSINAVVRSWISLFDMVQPDLVVCDHSPMALLASRAITTKRVTIGTGFCCPSPTSLFRDLRPELPLEPGHLAQEEEALLQNANAVLASLNATKIECLADLYAEVDAPILTTFAELDHYSDRGRTEYWGTWSEVGGQKCIWPQGEGKRVFAYISPFRAFPALLDKLQSTGCPTIIYAKGLSPSLRARLETSTVRFADGRIDLTQVGRSCDLAILNGGHGTTASMLLAGRPILQIPHYLEQSMNAQAVVRLGAGLAVSGKNAKGIEQALDAMLLSADYRKAARQFAQKHQSHRGAEAVDRVLGRLEQLLPPLSRAARSVDQATSPVAA